MHLAAVYPYLLSMSAAYLETYLLPICPPYILQWNPEYGDQQYGVVVVEILFNSISISIRLSVGKGRQENVL